MREGKTLIGCLSYMLPTGDRTHNPGMCPDWGLNQRPSALPHWPGRQRKDLNRHSWLQSLCC